MPTLNSTLRTAHASQWIPSFASVAYAEAMSIVGTSSTPSVIDGTASRPTVMPMRWAASTIASAPTSTASCANTTFTEFCVAPHRSRYPPLLPPSAFWTHPLALIQPSRPQSGDADE